MPSAVASSTPRPRRARASSAVKRTDALRKGGQGKMQGGQRQPHRREGGRDAPGTLQPTQRASIGRQLQLCSAGSATATLRGHRLLRCSLGGPRLPSLSMLTRCVGVFPFVLDVLKSNLPPSAVLEIVPPSWTTPSMRAADARTALEPLVPKPSNSTSLGEAPGIQAAVAAPVEKRESAARHKQVN